MTLTTAEATAEPEVLPHHQHQWFCFIALRVLQEAVTTDDQWAECSKCNTSFFSRSGILVVDFKFKLSRLFHIGLNLFGLEGWLVIWLSFRQAVRVTVMKLFFLIHYVRNAISDINNSWPSNYSVSSHGYQFWFSGSYFVVYWKRAAGGWNCGIVDRPVYRVVWHFWTFDNKILEEVFCLCNCNIIVLWMDAARGSMKIARKWGWTRSLVVVMVVTDTEGVLIH